MHKYEAAITRTDHRCGTSNHLELHCPPIAGEVSPGQFVQVRVGEGTDPFLRRTLSVSGADTERGTLRLTVDAVGRGTEQLCSMTCGESVSLLGPLGTSFDPTLGGSGKCVLVAGGVGIAPLLFLASRLTTIGRPAIFLLGARTAGLLGIADGELPSTTTLRTATDDGSAGHHGFVTDLLRDELSHQSVEAVFVCGPDPMMRAAAAIASEYTVPCQVSLEERMACGLGACYGCVVERRDGAMVRTCVDGPVFDATEVYWR